MTPQKSRLSSPLTGRIGELAGRVTRRGIVLARHLPNPLADNVTALPDRANPIPARGNRLPGRASWSVALVHHSAACARRPAGRVSRSTACARWSASIVPQRVRVRPRVCQSFRSLWALVPGPCRSSSGVCVPNAESHQSTLRPLPLHSVDRARSSTVGPAAGVIGASRSPLCRRPAVQQSPR